MMFSTLTCNRGGWRVLRLLGLSAAVWLAAVAVSGCASTKPEDDPALSAEKLYSDAREDIAAGSFESALRKLQRVEGRAAGTLLAQQASIDLAYAQYRVGERVEALATLDRFIKLNPSSPAIDYAYYLRGIVNFNDNLGILGALANQDLSERDQQASRDAYQSFKQLVDLFPNSKYAPDARVRMDYIVNALAEYELHVARYYFRRGAFVAAANRAQQAILEFRQTPVTEEALYIMVQCYDRLGLTELRDDSGRVLALNFPDSRYAREGLRERPKAWWQVW